MKRILHLLSFAMSSMPAALLQARWKPSLVMAIAPAILSAPNALLIARLAGARSWLHIQDYEFEAATRLGILPGNTTLRKWMQIFERAILMRFDRVSSISPTMIDRAVKVGVLEERIELIPNWVDVEGIYPNGSDREAFGIPGEKVICLYSGNLGQKQGLSSVISIARRMEKIPEIHFVLCGEGSMRPEIEELAAQAANVQYLPLQPEEKLNALLNAADIHLLPELPGASDLVMPSKLGPMMASGRPVLVTAPEGSELAIIGSIGGLVVPPGDLQALETAIKRLAANPEERKRLGEAGRSYVIRNWQMESVLSKFMGELEALVVGDGKPE
jgi:colanic acid biosynthesis glycosyl transferase WcaI